MLRRLPFTCAATLLLLCVCCSCITPTQAGGVGATVVVGGPNKVGAIVGNFGSPANLAISPDGRVLHVTDQTRVNRVYLSNKEMFSAIYDQYSTLLNITGVCVDPNDHAIWWVGYDGAASGNLYYSGRNFYDGYDDNSDSPLFYSSTAKMSSSLATPTAMAVDKRRRFYILSDSGSNKLIYTVQPVYSGTAAPVQLTASSISSRSVQSIAVDGDGSFVYFPDGSTVKRLNVSSGVIESYGSSQPFTGSRLTLSVNPDVTGELYVFDDGTKKAYRISSISSVPVDVTVASGITATFYQPKAIAFNKNANSLMLLDGVTVYQLPLARTTVTWDADQVCVGCGPIPIRINLGAPAVTDVIVTASCLISGASTPFSLVATFAVAHQVGVVYYTAPTSITSVTTVTCSLTASTQQYDSATGLTFKINLPGVVSATERVSTPLYRTSFNPNWGFANPVSPSIPLSVKWSSDRYIYVVDSFRQWYVDLRNGMALQMDYNLNINPPNPAGSPQLGSYQFTTSTSTTKQRNSIPSRDPLLQISQNLYPSRIVVWFNYNSKTFDVPAPINRFDCDSFYSCFGAGSDGSIHRLLVPANGAATSTTYNIHLTAGTFVNPFGIAVQRNTASASSFPMIYVSDQGNIYAINRTNVTGPINTSPINAQEIELSADDSVLYVFNSVTKCLNTLQLTGANAGQVGVIGSNYPFNVAAGVVPSFDLAMPTGDVLLVAYKTAAGTPRIDRVVLKVADAFAPVVVGTAYSQTKTSVDLVTSFVTGVKNLREIASIYCTGSAFYSSYTLDQALINSYYTPRQMNLAYIIADQPGSATCTVTMSSPDDFQLAALIGHDRAKWPLSASSTFQFTVIPSSPINVTVPTITYYPGEDIPITLTLNQDVVSGNTLVVSYNCLTSGNPSFYTWSDNSLSFSTGVLTHTFTLGFSSTTEIGLVWCNFALSGTDSNHYTIIPQTPKIAIRPQQSITVTDAPTVVAVSTSSAISVRPADAPRVGMSLIVTPTCNFGTVSPTSLTFNSSDWAAKTFVYTAGSTASPETCSFTVNAAESAHYAAPSPVSFYVGALETINRTISMLTPLYPTQQRTITLTSSATLSASTDLTVSAQCSTGYIDGPVAFAASMTFTFTAPPSAGSVTCSFSLSGSDVTHFNPIAALPITITPKARVVFPSPMLKQTPAGQQFTVTVSLSEALNSGLGLTMDVQCTDFSSTDLTASVDFSVAGPYNYSITTAATARPYECSFSLSGTDSDHYLTPSSHRFYSGVRTYLNITTVEPTLYWNQPATISALMGEVFSPTFTEMDNAGRVYRLAVSFSCNYYGTGVSTFSNLATAQTFDLFSINVNGPSVVTCTFAFDSTSSVSDDTHYVMNTVTLSWNVIPPVRVIASAPTVVAVSSPFTVSVSLPEAVKAGKQLDVSVDCNGNTPSGLNTILSFNSSHGLSAQTYTVTTPSTPQPWRCIVAALSVVSSPTSTDSYHYSTDSQDVVFYIGPASDLVNVTVNHRPYGIRSQNNYFELTVASNPLNGGQDLTVNFYCGIMAPFSITLNPGQSGSSNWYYFDDSSTGTVRCDLSFSSNSLSQGLFRFASTGTQTSSFTLQMVDIATVSLQPMPGSSSPFFIPSGSSGQLQVDLNIPTDLAVQVSIACDALSVSPAVLSFSPGMQTLPVTVTVPVGTKSGRGDCWVNDIMDVNNNYAGNLFNYPDDLYFSVGEPISFNVTGIPTAMYPGQTVGPIRIVSMSRAPLETVSINFNANNFNVLDNSNTVFDVSSRFPVTKMDYYFTSTAMNDWYTVNVWKPNGITQINELRFSMSNSYNYAPVPDYRIAYLAPQALTTSGAPATLSVGATSSAITVSAPADVLAGGLLVDIVCTGSATATPSRVTLPAGPKASATATFTVKAGASPEVFSCTPTVANVDGSAFFQIDNSKTSPFKVAVGAVPTFTFTVPPSTQLVGARVPIQLTPSALPIANTQLSLDCRGSSDSVTFPFGSTDPQVIYAILPSTPAQTTCVFSVDSSQFATPASVSFIAGTPLRYNVTISATVVPSGALTPINFFVLPGSSVADGTSLKIDVSCTVGRIVVVAQGSTVTQVALLPIDGLIPKQLQFEAPLASGPVTCSFSSSSSDRAWTDPDPITFRVMSRSVMTTAISGNTLGSSSVTVRVTPSVAVELPQGAVITPSCSGGVTVSPSTLTYVYGSSSAQDLTVTYTGAPVSSAAVSCSFTSSNPTFAPAPAANSFNIIPKVSVLVNNGAGISSSYSAGSVNFFTMQPAASVAVAGGIYVTAACNNTATNTPLNSTALAETSLFFDYQSSSSQSFRFTAPNVYSSINVLCTFTISGAAAAQFNPIPAATFTVVGSGPCGTCAALANLHLPSVLMYALLGVSAWLLNKRY